MFRLAQKHLFDQVVQHEAVAAGEGLDERGGVGAPLHGERGQLQAGNPALGAGFQGGDLGGGQVQPHHLVEELGGFVRGEAQVGGAQLDELAAGAAAGPAAAAGPRGWQ